MSDFWAWIKVVKHILHMLSIYFAKTEGIKSHCIGGSLQRILPKLPQSWIGGLSVTKTESISRHSRSETSLGAWETQKALKIWQLYAWYIPGICMSYIFPPLTAAEVDELMACNASTLTSFIILTIIYAGWQRPHVSSSFRFYRFFIFDIHTS